MKYLIDVVEKLTESRFVYIEADSEKEAARLARDAVINGSRTLRTKRIAVEERSFFVKSGTHPSVVFDEGDFETQGKSA